MSEKLPETLNLDYFNNLPFGICLTDQNFRILFWNRHLADWSRITHDQIQGKDITEIYPHLQEKSYLRRLNLVLEGGPPVIFSAQLHPYFFHLPDKEGGLRKLQTTVSSLVEFTSGERLLLICINDMSQAVNQLRMINDLRKNALKEIQERKAIQEKLQASEDRYRTLIEALPFAVFVQKDNTVLYSNKRALDLFRLDNKEILNDRSVIDYIHMDDLKGFNKHLQRAQEGKFTKEFFEFRLLIEPEIIIPAEATLIPIIYEGAEAVQILITDVSEKKIIEEERLQKEKLQSILELAGAVCHELNQPMQIALGFSELIIGDELEIDSARRYVTTVNDQITRMSSIVNNLQNITTYQTKDYINSKIIDIEGSSRVIED